jgi:ubiquinone/menaquinone biosynthesis C-methylase UbiE
MPRGLPSPTTPSSYQLYEGITYQDYWCSKDTANSNTLEHAIIRELLPPHGSLLLDLGCGYGRIADCYLDHFENVVMFDGSRSLLEGAQKATCGKAHYVWGDINHLPFRSSVFDCVIMVRVFQHLDDSRGCMQSVSRILCQDGYFIFNYWNNRNVRRILKYILGMIRQNPFTTEPVQLEANLYHHHPNYISGLLSAADFEILTYRGAGVFNRMVAAAGFFADFIPAGISLAPFLGRFFLAPWIFCQARLKKDDRPQSVSRQVSWLICPCCGLELVSSTNGFECRGCGRSYPVKDGIVDMRIDR